MGVPPSLPHRGDAAQGDNPLDPISTFLPYLKRISRQPPEGCRIFYGCPSGGGVKSYRSPKERQNNFLLIFYKKPGNDTDQGTTYEGNNYIMMVVYRQASTPALSRRYPERYPAHRRRYTFLLPLHRRDGKAGNSGNYSCCRRVQA